MHARPCLWSEILYSPCSMHALLICKFRGIMCRCVGLLYVRWQTTSQKTNYVLIWKQTMVGVFNVLMVCHIQVRSLLGRSCAGEWWGVKINVPASVALLSFVFKDTDGYYCHHDYGRRPFYAAVADILDEKLLRSEMLRFRQVCYCFCVDDPCQLLLLWFFHTHACYYSRVTPRHSWIRTQDNAKEVCLCVFGKSKISRYSVVVQSGCIIWTLQDENCHHLQTPFNNVVSCCMSCDA